MAACVSGDLVRGSRCPHTDDAQELPIEGMALRLLLVMKEDRR